MFVSTGQGLTGANMFAYCNNNPVCFVDYQGTRVYGALGLSVSGNVGAGGSYGIMTIWDDKGNWVDIETGYYGPGTPNLGISVDLGLYSSADDVFQFAFGSTVCWGASYGPVSIETHSGVDLNGKSFKGIIGSAGVSVLPAEVHLGPGFSRIIKISSYKGNPVPSNVTMNYFSDLDPKAQVYLQEQMGFEWGRNAVTAVGGGGGGKIYAEAR